MSRKIYVFDEHGMLVLKPEKRVRRRNYSDEDEDLRAYVENRQTRAVEELADGSAEVFSYQHDPDPPRHIPLGTFRVRASDAMNVFDEAIGNYWDRDRLRREFESSLVEFIEGWRGQRALEALVHKEKR